MAFMSLKVYIFQVEIVSNIQRTTIFFHLDEINFLFISSYQMQWLFFVFFDAAMLVLVLGCMHGNIIIIFLYFRHFLNKRTSLDCKIFQKSCNRWLIR